MIDPRDIHDDLLRYSEKPTQEYIVAFGGNSRELQEHVNDLLKKGWTLHGGISISPSTTFYQALVRNVSGE